MFTNPILHRIESIYNLFLKLGNNLQSLFLLYMRLTWGHQFMRGGWAKLHAMDETAAFLASLNFHHPLFNAYCLGISELLFGACLFIGLASRIVTLPLIWITLIALSTAHAADISNFRFLLEPLALVRQPPYPFLITCILVFCFGPGRVSIDAWLKRWAAKKPRY